MNDNMYRSGGNDILNLPVNAAHRRKQLLIDCRNFDNKYGIPISQQARHTIPNWILILACLPACDSGEYRTVEEIQTIITDLEYPIRRQSILNVLRPMLSRNVKKQMEMSKIVRETLALIGGIRKETIVEDNCNMGSYSLGIDTLKLKILVDNCEFTTYSFNLNDDAGVTLIGKV